MSGNPVKSSRPVRWTVFCAVVLLACGALAQTADTTDALERALGGAIQTELPATSAPDPATPVPGRNVSFIIPVEIVRVVWILAILLVAFWLVRAYVLPNVTGESDDDGDASAESVFDEESLPLPDFEGLARSGRFGEAVHVLLLRVLVLTARRLRVPLPVARTSREALRAWPLPADRQDDLGRIVASVEASHFGDRPVDEDEYRVCLAAYRRLAGGEGGRA